MSNLLQEAESLATALDNPASVMIRKLIAEIKQLDGYCKKWSDSNEKMFHNYHYHKSMNEHYMREAEKANKQYEQIKKSVGL